MTTTELGEVSEGCVAQFDIDASDDRLTGAATYPMNMHYFGSDDVQYPAGVMVGTVVLEAEDGTWEGSFVSTDYAGTLDHEGHHVLAGTGAYEGLTVVMTTLDSLPRA